MSFLGGAFLFALPLAAVPIVIHLLNRRRRQVVKWGAMHLLMESVPRRRRIWRIDDIILMALRALAVLAIVLALARPQIRSSFFTGRAPGRDVILVVDTSLSTGRMQNGTPVLDAIKQKATEVVERAGDNDRIRLMVAAQIPHWESFDVAANESAPKAQLLERINAFKTTQATADMPSCIQAALQADVADEATGRSVVVITDGTEHGWNTEAGPMWQAVREAAEHAAVPTAVNVVTVEAPGTALSNLSIDKLDVTRTRVAAGETFSVTAHVRNTGEGNHEASKLKWDIEGDGTSDIPVAALEPGQSVDVSFEASCDSLGPHQLVCSLIGDDDLPLDNNASLVVESVERLPVLICRAEANLVLPDSQPDFLQAALGRHLKKDKNPGGLTVFAPTVVSVETLAGIDLSQYRCVILDNILPTTAEAVDTLGDYVERGGGLWVILGEDVTADQFNSLLHRDGAGVSPIPLGTLVEAATDDADLISVHPPEGNHPATLLLGDTERLDINDVRISKHWTLDAGSAPEEVSVLLESGEGEPLAFEHIQGDGRVIFLSLPCNTQWSNLPVCQVFVPLAQEWVWYLTQPTATHYNLDAGSPIVASFLGVDRPKEASMTTPLGETVVLATGDKPAGTELRFRGTDFPGEYNLVLKPAKGKEQELPFVVRRDADESKLARLSEPQTTLLAQTGGLRFEGDPLSLPESAVDRIQYQPFWNYLLVLVALLFAAECLFSLFLTKKRYAAVPQSMPVVSTTAQGLARKRRQSA